MYAAMLNEVRLNRPDMVNVYTSQPTPYVFFGMEPDVAQAQRGAFHQNRGLVPGHGTQCEVSVSWRRKIM